MTFYEEIFKLKLVIRKGWQMRNVPERIESDAEHTFSMLLLGLDIMNKNKLEIDELKVLKMIAYHELCEIDVGDITPYDNVSKEEKFNNEYKCIKRLADECNLPEIESIWLEFKEGKTLEAKFVKEIGKLDAVLQSKIYADKYNRPELFDEFNNTFLSAGFDINKYKI